jgi:hypothetical protein
LSTLEVASATPSIKPMKVGAPPNEAMNTGKSGKIISEPMSVRKLVKPRAITVLGSCFEIFCARITRCSLVAALTQHKPATGSQ